ncbi:MAG: hypothetical protein Q9166_000976 [cf. Caloplaca sp. 2 TL-2023]
MPPEKSKRRQDPSSRRQAEFVAEVIKAQRCTSVEYQSNQWSDVFEYSIGKKANRCFLRGKGGIAGLELTLFRTAEFKDENPETIHELTFPAPDAKLSLRLYDSNGIIEIFTDPNQKKGQEAVGDYWTISLRGHSDFEKIQAPKLLRWLESVAREMPDNWFRYRNFFTVPGARDAAVPPPVAAGQYNHEMAGSGGSMKFTGNLASAPFLVALGYRNVHPRVKSLRTQTQQVRGEDANKDAYRFSTMAPSLRPRRKGEKSKKISARQTKLEAKRGRRAIAVSNDSRPQGGQIVQVVIPQSTGVQTTAAKQSADLPIAATDEPGAQSPTAAANSPQSRVATADQGDESEADAEDPSPSYTIRRILDDGENSDGEVMYYIDWEPQDGIESTPTWQPEENVDVEALVAYRQEKASRKRKGKRAPGRPKKKGKK